MPVSPTYPGIYIQEAPSSSHTIVAAPTNIAVFIGYTHPLKTLATNLGQAVEIFGFTDYTTGFGSFLRSAAFTNAYGPDIRSGGYGNPGVFGDMAQAVNQFFLNGGTTAYIVALNNGTLTSLLPSMVWLSGGTLSALASQSEPPSDGITFSATEVTDELYAMAITIRPIPPTSPPSDPLADIIITYGPASTTVTSPPSSSSAVVAGPGTAIETYRRVSLNPVQPDGKTPNPNYIVTRIGTPLAPVSALATVSVGPTLQTWPASTTTQIFALYLSQTTNFYDPSDYTAVLQEDMPLDKVSVFNLMILPGIADNSATWSGDESGSLILSTAIAFCERKMAFLVMDPPVADSADGTVAPAPGTVPSGVAQSNMIQNTMNQGSLPLSKNAALYFPYLLSPDPISGSATNYVTGLPSQIPPAATTAGIYSATDLARGVWKAPAGFQAVTNNVTGVVARGVMTDQRQGTLNPLGVNCLRLFPNIPTIVFGARTLATTYDQQWTYVPVRRMALFLEQTLYANLKWVIFEPNATPLWSAITMSINAFMLGLFKQGAFQGDTPSQAFSVQCDSQTTTQADIDSGIVNIVVGFAPLQPAEFVIITIAQLAGQTQTS
jgi:uncharacterized protein